MKKLFLAGAVALLMVAAVLTAGCATTTTPSPTPTHGTQTTAISTNATTGVTNVSQYLTTTMQDRNFTIVTSFSPQPNPRNGFVRYSGVVSDRNGTYNVTYYAFNTPQAAQTRYHGFVNGYMTRGYAMMQQNSTTWSGFNSASSMGVGVEYGTSPLMPYYVMVMRSYSTAPQTPMQQSMWSHMWGEIREHMGPNLGQNLAPDMRQHMHGDV
ncbi:MAG: hypothetical protein WCE81_03615 [Halobacteriota archaeon]